MLSCPQTLPAITVASQTILTSLLGLDNKAATMSQPALRSIQRMLHFVLQPTISKLQKEDPSSAKLDDIRGRLKIYDMMASMPPAIGKC